MVENVSSNLWIITFCKDRFDSWWFGDNEDWSLFRWRQTIYMFNVYDFKTRIFNQYLIRSIFVQCYHVVNTCMWHLFTCCLHLWHILWEKQESPQDCDWKRNCLMINFWSKVYRTGNVYLNSIRIFFLEITLKHLLILTLSVIKEMYIIRIEFLHTQLPENHLQVP